MGTSVGRLARLSAIYVAGDIITRGASFLLLPLYTRFLDPQAYGIIAVAEMVKQVLITLVSLGAVGGILRAYYQLPDEAERRRFYGGLWTFLAGVSGALLLALGLVASRAGDLFRAVPFDPYLRLTLWSVWLYVGFGLLPPALFRAREQAGRYVAFSALSFLATASATIYLVAGRGLGAEGYLYGQVAGGAAAAVFGSALLLREIRPRLRWPHLGPLLAYSLPLVPHLLAHWVLGVADRAILERAVPMAAVGVYSLGYQFGLVYYMLISAVNNALFPAFGRAGNDPAARAALPRLATYYVLAIAALGLAIGLAGGDLITLATPPEYHAAAGIVPLVALGYFCTGLYQIPLSAITLTAGKTGAVPLVTAAVAALNLLLNLLLVGRLGIYGAALSTIGGYAALAVGMFLLARRLGPLPYEYGRIARVVAAAALLAALGLASAGLPPLAGIACDLALVAALPLALLALGFWTPEERRALRGLAGRLRARGAYSE